MRCFFCRHFLLVVDISDVVCENDNDIFCENNLIYVDNMSKRISRLWENTANLRSTVEHLQDSYSIKCVELFIHLDENIGSKILNILGVIDF